MKKSEALKLNNKMLEFFTKVEEEAVMTERTIEVAGLKISRAFRNNGANDLIALRKDIQKMSNEIAADRDLRPSQAREIESWTLANMAQEMSKSTRYLITGFMHGHYSRYIQDRILFVIWEDLMQHVSVKRPLKWGTLEGYWDKEDWEKEAAGSTNIEQMKKAIKEASEAYLAKRAE